MKEHALIAAIRKKCPSNSTVIVGIDDDAAVLRPSERASLVCTDMLMEGVHFLLDEDGPRAIGRKALAVNLSDIAAMGGRATSAFISLALPRGRLDQGFVDALYDGMGEIAGEFSVAIAGGDTNIWDGPLVVNVTVLGEAHPNGVVLRSGAKAGDRIFVTGALGGSLAGHHLTFQPRLREAEQLMDHFALTSLMDVSDGLAKDLREISRLSSVRIDLEADKIPIQPGIATEPDALRRALCDGEDFELCFTLSQDEAERLQADPRFAYCRAIGSIVSGEGLFWSDGKPISWHGYQHGEAR